MRNQLKINEKVKRNLKIPPSHSPILSKSRMKMCRAASVETEIESGSSSTERVFRFLAIALREVVESVRRVVRGRFRFSAFGF